MCERSSIMTEIINVIQTGYPALIALILTAACAIWCWFSSKLKKGRIVTPINILIFGTFCSAALCFFPVLADLIKTGTGRSAYTEALLSAMQFAFRLFILDGDIMWIADASIPLFADTAVKDFYVNLSAILYVVAPILTFSFIASMFISVFSRILYFVLGYTHTHVFSELNEKSLALAKNITGKRKAIILLEKEISKKERSLSSKMEEIEKLRAGLGARELEYNSLKANLDQKIKKYDDDFASFKKEYIACNGKYSDAILAKKNGLYKWHIDIEAEAKVLSARKDNINKDKRIVESFDLDTQRLALDKIQLEKLKSDPFLKDHRRNAVVFTDIAANKLKERDDLIEEARAIGAIMFENEIELGKYKRFSLSPRKLSFYLISDDEDKKLRHAEHIMKHYDKPDTTLRLFSCDKRSELLMASKTSKHIKAIRVDDIQSLIYRNLYEEGKFLFDGAREVNGKKVISAVIVGLGLYGREMLKALSWFCQMDGYLLKITAFDSDKLAEEKIKFECPQLLDENYNGKPLEGEPYYEINIHSGIDVNTDSFKKKLQEITDVTYAFVCLGSDEQNIRTATDVRSIFEGMSFPDGNKPEIETVVYNSHLAEQMGTSRSESLRKLYPGVVNFKKKPYNIIMTGDLERFYSTDTFINFKAELDGLAIHKVWGDEESFWQYEYNYKSSIAKAIHLAVREQLGCPLKKYEDFDWSLLTREAMEQNADLEHKRWSAYMRSEGYSFRGKTVTRNDIAKIHNLLVPTDKLPDSELKKD